MGLRFVSGFSFYQEQGVACHGKAAEKHGRCSDDRIQKSGGGHRDADDVIN